MLIFHLCKIIFLLFVFPHIIIDTFNIGHRLKALAFRRYKYLIYKYCPKFVKMFKKHPNKIDIRQFLVLLYNCVPNIKHYCSIDRLLKNVVLQVGTSKNPTTLFYCDTKKGKFFEQKNIKITKREHALKSFASTYNVEILNSFNLEIKLKDIESTIKI